MRARSVGFNQHKGVPTRTEKDYRSAFLIDWFRESDTTARSIGAIGKQKGRYRYNHYLRVQSHRPLARIKRVTCDALAIGDVAATADLPEPSDARPARKVGVYGPGIPVQLFLGNGARSYDAHIAPKDVKQLRQLIQA